MKRTKHNFTTQLALEAFKSTGYLIVNKVLIKKFGLIPAAVLSNYIDKYQYFQNTWKKFNGWFFLRHDDIMEQLNLKRHTVIEAKKKFIKLGILQTEMRSVPAKEWIWIDFQSLVSKCLDPKKTKGLDPKKIRGLYKENKYKGKQIHSAIVRNEEFFPLAEYLAKIIQTTKNIQYSGPILKSWTNDVRKLSEVNKIDPKRIKKALRWYKNNVGGQYIPVIESGMSLRSKFLKLEAARVRSENGFEKGEQESQSQEDVERAERGFESKFGK